MCGKLNNRNIPFEDNAFDLLLSINVIHYEGSLENVEKALKEYSRVLAPGGRLLLSTVGPSHVILQRAKSIERYCYEIRDYDFRNGTRFFCFETKDYLKACLEKEFSGVETGRVTEQLMNYELDFLLGSAEAVK